MAGSSLKRKPLSWLSIVLLAGAYACGSSSDSGDASPGNGDGSGASGDGSGASGDGSGASGDGSGASSAGGAPGSGSGGSSATSGIAGNTTTGPQWDGSGSGFRPLTTGCGPETADDCTGACEQTGGDPGTVIRPPATLCFAGEGDLTPDDPAVVIEQVIEEVNGQAYVHIRITFDPAFTDNTFGEGSCCGWPDKRGHRFGDLTGSDHTELLLTDGSGETMMHFKVDLVTEDPSSPCGFGSLGVEGGDGDVLIGDPADVLAVATSLDRNLNGCGYCENTACGASGDCTESSPSTDEGYTPNPETPEWDYRQVYEVWIALEAFGDEGFGQAYVTYTHSSPAKGTDTLQVEPTPCPPEWDEPYCPPSVIAEGGNCFGGGGTGGTGSGGTDGGAGADGSGGSGGACPPNYQVYITSEGASLCTPIPYANYDDMKPCPDGYMLDLASEGQYCVPAM